MGESNTFRLRDRRALPSGGGCTLTGGGETFSPMANGRSSDNRWCLPYSRAVKRVSIIHEGTASPFSSCSASPGNSTPASITV